MNNDKIFRIEESEPTEEFREIQEFILKSIKIPNNVVEINSLRDAAANIFRQTFQLGKYTRRLSFRLHMLLREVNRTCIASDIHIFDHDNVYFQHGIYSMVLQPYRTLPDTPTNDVSLDHLKRILVDNFEMDVLVADKWSFHYPGKTRCFILKFNPKIYRMDREHWYIRKYL